MGERPNDTLRRARLAMPSPSGSGEPMSRQELAEQVNAHLLRTAKLNADLDGNYIGKLERGVHRWPGAAYRQAFRAVLGAATDAELGFYITGRTRNAPTMDGDGPARQPILATGGVHEGPVPLSPGAASAGLAGLHPSVEPAHRAGDVDPDPLVLATLVAQSSTSTRLAEHLERVAYAQVARYPCVPAQQMWPVVRAQLTHIATALSTQQSLRCRRRLTQVTAILAGLAGNLAVDLNRPARAYEYLSLSRLAADEAEDADLAAWATGLHSIDTFLAGNLRDTVDLLDYATGIARTASSPRRQSWLAALRARAYAAAGDHRAARTALDEAHTAIQDVEPARGTDFFDQDRLDGMTGTTYLLLRDPARAMDFITRAVRSRSPSDAKGRALLTLDKAACHLLQDEPEAAVTAIHQALDLARGQYVNPIVVRANDLRRSMRGYDHGPAGSGLDDRLLEIDNDVRHHG